MKFTNYSNGPRGVQGPSGVVMIDAGATVDITDIRDGDAKAAKKSGWFTKPDEAEEPAVEAPVSLTGKNKAELLEIAKAEGVEGIADDATNPQIVEAITAKRANPSE